MFFKRKQKAAMGNATPVMGGAMFDFATAERQQALRRDAGYLPVALAAKRDVSIERLGKAYQLHPEYRPENYPHHPRIGVARTDSIIERHNYRAGVDL